MFPTLHASIKTILESADPATITQFVLEPLAFPQLLANLRSHGEQYAHQLSFLTRTFAFYIHREYQMLLKRINDPTQLVTLQCDDPNAFPVSVASCESTPHTLPAPARGHQYAVTRTQPEQYDTGHSSSVCDPISTTHAIVRNDLFLGQVASTAPVQNSTSEPNIVPAEMVGARHSDVTSEILHLLAKRDQHEPVILVPLDELGHGGGVGGGEVAGLRGDSEHDPSHNQSLTDPPRSLETSHHNHSLIYPRSLV